MPFPPDPQRRWRFAVAAIVGAAVLVDGAILWWACRAPAPVTLPAVADGTAVAAIATPPVDPNRWQVALWRPLTDQPAQSAAPPPSVKLFSVFKRGTDWVAALDIGAAGGLAYAKAGEVVSGITVVAIDATGADLLVQGARQRVEVSR